MITVLYMTIFNYHYMYMYMYVFIACTLWKCNCNTWHVHIKTFFLYTFTSLCLMVNHIFAIRNASVYEFQILNDFCICYVWPLCLWLIFMWSVSWSGAILFFWFVKCDISVVISQVWSPFHITSWMDSWISMWCLC